MAEGNPYGVIWQMLERQMLERQLLERQLLERRLLERLWVIALVVCLSVLVPSYGAGKETKTEAEASAAPDDAAKKPRRHRRKRRRRRASDEKKKIKKSKRRRRKRKKRRRRRRVAKRRTIQDTPVHPPKDGFAPPYAYDNLMRGFDGNGCEHQGLDIGGVGEHYGVGTPVFAIAKAEVTHIGVPGGNSKKYGTFDRREGTLHRGGEDIPRALEVPGYGTVHPFSRKQGSSRTGVLVVTKLIGTELDGHKVRYMHLAAVHPELDVGDTIVAGQEVGLMGATGVGESPPHLHLDIEDHKGYRVDPAPLLGLQEVRPSKCKPRRKVAKKKAKKRKKKRRKKKHRRRRSKSRKDRKDREDRKDRKD